MIHRPIVCSLIVAALGCAPQRSTNRGVGETRSTWVASKASGDKPGFGIKLEENVGKVSGTFFLLDPNKPHDFNAGKSFPTEVVRTTETELRFVVHLDDGRKDEFVVSLQGALRGSGINATLRDFEPGTQPMSLRFLRQH